MFKKKKKRTAAIRYKIREGVLIHKKVCRPSFEAQYALIRTVFGAIAHPKTDHVGDTWGKECDFINKNVD